METLENTENEEEIFKSEWVRFGLRLGLSAALHPFEYSKVLIQLGYEPITPRLGRSLFGRPTAILPNIFQYAGYIKSIDGFFGCYRGLSPKIVGSVIGTIFSEKIANKLQPASINNDEDKYSIERSNEEELIIFQTELRRDIIIHVSGIIITQPFHVISLRMMAQFIGREKVYTSLTASIVEIYTSEGLRGFFSGIIPKLLCDLFCLALTSTAVYFANKYMIRDKSTRKYFAGITQFVLSSVLYPLQVVSTCMSISGSRIQAGNPPIMPKYNNWFDCYQDLRARGEHKRGNSLFWRYANVGNNLRFSYAPMPAMPKLKEL